MFHKLLSCKGAFINTLVGSETIITKSSQGGVGVLGNKEGVKKVVYLNKGGGEVLTTQIQQQKSVLRANNQQFFKCILLIHAKVHF